MRPRIKLPPEAYPNAGDPNPAVELFVYDVEEVKRSARQMSATASRRERRGGYYVYPELVKVGKELSLFGPIARRTSWKWSLRPGTGKCRVQFTRKWLPDW